MSSRIKLYYLLQILGWSTYFLGNILNSVLQSPEGDFTSSELWMDLFPPTLILIFLGIIITHLFRKLVHKYHWNELSIPKTALIWVLSSPLMSLVFCGFSYLIFVVLLDNLNNVLNIDSTSFFVIWSNVSIAFILWNLIYFLIHIFQNFKASEIKNLKLQAANSQMELNQLRAQMNPHFLFNSLNSVRALIDEDPKKAKNAINLISGLLRSSISRNNEKLVAFSEELDIVKKYIGIEKIRFEERIEITYHIEPETESLLIPPFIVQTLVENAIKHGITKRKEGGIIKLYSKICESNHCIEVYNSGQIKKNMEFGYGIQNTSDRLELLYAGAAEFKLEEKDGMVVASIKLPIEKT